MGARSDRHKGVKASRLRILAVSVFVFLTLAAGMVWYLAIKTTREINTVPEIDASVATKRVTFKIIDQDIGNNIPGVELGLETQKKLTDKLGVATIEFEDDDKADINITAPGYPPAVVTVDPAKGSYVKLGLFGQYNQWSGEGLDSSRSAYQKSTGAKPPYKRWWKKDAKPDGDKLLVDNGMIHYFAGGKLTGLREKTGKQIWQFAIKGGGTPAYFDDYLYIGGESGMLYCLGASDGSLVWKKQLAGSNNSSPGSAPGKVFSATSEGILYCLDSETGKLLWKSAKGSAITNAPAYADGSVVTADQRGAVSCYSLKGKLQWRNTLKSTVLSYPVVSYGQVFVSLKNGGLASLLLQTGKMAWSAKAGAVTAPAVADGSVFVGTSQSSLMAVDATKGKILWNVKTAGRVDGQPVVIGDNVYFDIVTPGFAMGSKVIALDKRGGGKVWEREGSGPIATVGSSLYITSTAGLENLKHQVLSVSSPK